MAQQGGLSKIIETDTVKKILAQLEANPGTFVTLSKETFESLVFELQTFV